MIVEVLPEDMGPCHPDGLRETLLEFAFFCLNHLKLNHSKHTNSLNENRNQVPSGLHGRRLIWYYIASNMKSKNINETYQ